MGITMQYHPMHLRNQIDNDFPHHAAYKSVDHGMDVNDIPESWFIDKGLSNKNLLEDTGTCRECERQMISNP